MGGADETVNHRLRQAALESQRSPGLTIRPDKRGNTKRELPSISIDLRGTMPGPAGGTGRPAETRDLEVVRTLGEGGMARVFLARQHSLDRDVAIKTVRDAATETERNALLSEGAITGHLEHPSVIPVHALGVDDEGRPALVMKWVEGSTWLQRLIDGEHSLDANLETLMQVCNAVDFAHSRGIVHRDIKPDNVLLGRYGEVYLADWGIALRIAQQSADESLCGTPSYMAPEMVSGARIDERTDVYLLGAVLHRVLAGRARHVATNVRATLLLAMESTPATYGPEVPATLAQLANDATAPEPDARPANARIFRERIADYLRHKGSIALATSALERLPKLRASIEESAAHAQIDVLAAEARFAITEALRGWPDNPEAKRADQELTELLESRRRRAEELEKLARDLDPTVSRLPRVVGLSLFAIVAVGLSLPAVLGLRRDVTATQIFHESFGPLFIVGAILFGLRHRLLTTTFNRRAHGLLFLVVSSVTVHRGLALFAGTPAIHVLRSDALIIAILSFAGALFVLRWLLVPALLMLGAAVWAALDPPDAMRAFNAGTGVSILVCIFLNLRTKK